MIDPAILDAMVASGCTAEQIAAVVKAAMSAGEQQKASKRAGNAERQRRFRERNASNALHGVSNAEKVSPLSPPDKNTPIPPKNNPPYIPPSKLHGDTRDVLSERVADMLDALGITDETKSPGLLSLSEPYRWIAGGCDIDLDVIPALRGIGARGRVVRSWAYCSDAVFEARDRRLSPAPAVQPRSGNSPPPRKQTSASIWASEAISTGIIDHEPTNPTNRHMAQGDTSGSHRRAFQIVDASFEAS